MPALRALYLTARWCVLEAITKNALAEKMADLLRNTRYGTFREEKNAYDAAQARSRALRPGAPMGPATRRQVLGKIVVVREV